MTKLIVLMSIVLIPLFTGVADPLSAEERKFAADYLIKTQKALSDAVDGLSDKQLKYKPSPDVWSVEECVKHIAVTEEGLWRMTDSVIRAPANPEKRADIKATDQQVIDMLSDRSYKAKADEAAQPQNTKFTSMPAALESFNKHRSRLTDYVNQTNDALRDHVMIFPFGHFDTYQMILFIGAHSSRHTAQIEEVKNSPGFPKS